jgi:hypothetical protein
VHDERPDVDQEWDEIVEAPYRRVGQASPIPPAELKEKLGVD